MMALLGRVICCHRRPLSLEVLEEEEEEEDATKSRDLVIEGTSFFRRAHAKCFHVSLSHSLSLRAERGKTPMPPGEENEWSQASAETGMDFLKDFGRHFPFIAV